MTYSIAPAKRRKYCTQSSSSAYTTVAASHTNPAQAKTEKNIHPYEPPPFIESFVSPNKLINEILWLHNRAAIYFSIFLKIGQHGGTYDPHSKVVTLMTPPSA